MPSDKITAINKAIGEWFEENKGINEVAAKDLMPWFISKEIFPKDHQSGLPIRRLLRRLDKSNQLHLIPYVEAERKAQNTNWYFVRRVKGIQHSSENKGKWN